MEYNTQREKLKIPEYGRNIHNLIKYICTIKDRKKRNEYAKAVINIMGQLNPHLRDVPDFTHKLWNHLFIISDFKLDVDSPYPILKKNSLVEKPEKVNYPQHNIKLKHYGYIIEKIIKKIGDMKDDENKKKLIEIVANLMKKHYLSWNRNSVDDKQIIKDLKILSNGKISIQDINLISTSEILYQTRKRNKKRKKINEHI